MWEGNQIRPPYKNHFLSEVRLKRWLILEMIFSRKDLKYRLQNGASLSSKPRLWQESKMSLCYLIKYVL